MKNKPFRLSRDVIEFFEQEQKNLQGVQPPTLSSAIESLEQSPLDDIKDPEQLGRDLQELKKLYGSDALLVDVEKWSSIILDVVEFLGGRLNLCITAENSSGKRFSFVEVREGRYKCKASDCRHLHVAGDELLPVHGIRGQNPTNYVCIEDRGLLDNLDYPDYPKGYKEKP